jgi:hypothetical protein
MRFQSGEMTAQSRLPDTQNLCGSRNAACFSNLYELADLLEIIQICHASSV